MGGARSFEGAPISRLCFFGHVGASLLLSPAVKRDLAFDLGRTLAHGEVWRLVTHHVAFETLGEAVVGAVALYRFRRFERYFGSRKFCCFVAIAASATTAALSAGAVVFSRRDEGRRFFAPASGPYGLVFALFALFYELSPVVQPKFFALFGVHFSNKSLMYVAGLQLLAAHGGRSACPGAVGFLAGCAYLHDALGLHEIVLPKRFRWLFEPSDVDDAPGAPGAPRHVPETDDFGDLVPGDGDAPPGGAFETIAPSDEHVDSLVAMGFDRDRALAALLACNDNLERAADKLLA